MAIVAFTNNTKKTAHIGTKSIPAGETREVDETLLPITHPQEQTEQPPANPLTELLTGNVKDVLSKLNGYTADELGAIDQLEVGGSNRKGVLDGIANQLLVLAQASSNSDNGSDSDPDTGTDGNPDTGSDSNPGQE